MVVLNCWVTATNEMPLASKISTILAKSESDLVSRSTFLDDHYIDELLLDVVEQSL